MRFHLGPIPHEFEPDGSWRPIREPGPVVMQFIAVPIGIGVAFLVGYCWHIIGLSPVRFQAPHPGLVLFLFLLSFVVLILVHELLHAVVHPHFGRSRATIIGAWPSRGLFYAHYSGPLSRERFLAIFAMPFLVITVLPLIVAATGFLPPGFIIVAAWFSTWNALFACGDHFGMALILSQVPRGAIVQNQSWRTYWRLSNASAT